MSEKISVVVPVYNVEQYLRKCIDSLIDQSYDNLEIVLVDDGATDNCGAICDEYAEKYNNVKAFHKSNGGLSSARNYGVNVSTADWVVFVDSDDFVEPSYISDLWELKERFCADLVITRIVREKAGETNKKLKKPFDSFTVNADRAFYEVYNGRKVNWSAYGKLISKSALIDNPFPNGYFEDFAWAYKIIQSASKIAIADCQKNYHYVQREGSILVSRLNEKHLKIFELCDEIDNYIKTLYPGSGKYKCLSVMIYRHAVIQLLNLVKMTDEEFNTIFMKYKKLFRKNLLRVIFSTKYSFGQKAGLFLLCLNPKIYKRFAGLK